MADTYKLQYDGMTLTYPGWGGCVGYEAQSFKTLTLLNSEGGTLTANTLTGYPGDVINLTTAYNTYWRFSGYQLTGDGSLVGNDYTFGSEDATICACFKPNAFTASGGFEKGSDVYCRSRTNTNVTANIPAKYATVSYHTSNVPADWYSTSNRWKVTTTPSAYSITLNPKMTFGRKKDGAFTGSWGGAITAISLIGSTPTGSQSWTAQNSTSTAWTTDNYNKTFSTTTTGVNYGISAHLSARGYYNGAFGASNSGQSRYLAARTSGTWTATGYAP